MALRAPDEGEIILLQYIVNLIAPGNPVLRLYTTDVAVTDSVTAGGMTEASAAGYSAITLVGSNWTTTQVGGVTTAVYSEQTFNFTTSATVYGYYITSIVGGKCLIFERFSGAPFTIPSGGGSISISPALQLD